MNAYEEKRQKRVERLEKAADRKRQESEQLTDQFHKMGDVIPFGQPVHGAADRRYREKIGRKMDQAYQASLEAERLQARAEAAANNNAIFSDDPDAVTKLEDKIARLEKRQELMVAANKLIRKDDREGLKDLGFSDTQIVKLFMPDFAGRIGFPNYALTNNSANIRRLKERAKTLEAKKDDETQEVSIDGVKIIDNVEDNRLQVFFPGKPASNIIAALKSHGFHWTPSLGCWQRFRSNQANYWAQQIVKMEA